MWSNWGICCWAVGLDIHGSEALFREWPHSVPKSQLLRPNRNKGIQYLFLKIIFTMWPDKCDCWGPHLLLQPSLPLFKIQCIHKMLICPLPLDCWILGRSESLGRPRCRKPSGWTLLDPSVLASLVFCWSLRLPQPLFLPCFFSACS